MIPARELTAYVTLAAVLAFILSCGTSSGSRRVWFNEYNDNRGNRPTVGVTKIPDFSFYEPMRTLDAEEFPLDEPNRRVIVVGDIHGMFKPLSQLLTKAEYHHDTDILIHTGDMLAKGLHHHSMATLEFMTLHNITGVRGNHDQDIIRWRGWINWICSTTEGCDWLRRTEHTWRHMHGKKSFDLDRFLDSEEDLSSRQDRRWWKLIPAGWKFLSDQYRIARDMSNEQYEYLLQLPVALYIPSAHTFIVHAGLLPSDPRYPYYDSSRQPLARIPDISVEGRTASPCGPNLLCTDHLRRMQELSILTDVPQNKKPWVLMNMRSIKNGKIFRKYKGIYWTKLWNQEMKLCVGFKGALASIDGLDEELPQGSPKARSLPCYPSTVVYGHSASRGFTPKRWSIGLDSGCVYGRELTALILGGPRSRIDNVNGELINVEDEEDEDELDDNSEEGDVDAEHREEENSYDDDEDERAESNKRKRKKKKKSGDTIPFGDRHKAKIIAVKCR